MGQKGMRAMSPLQAATANDLRVKLGRGRDLPEEAKPKRAPKAKPAAEDGAVAVAPKPSRQKAADGTAAPKTPRKKAVAIETAEPVLPESTEEIKPAATLFRHTAAPPSVAEPEPALAPPSPPVVAPPATPVIAPAAAAPAPPPVVK